LGHPGDPVEWPSFAPGGLYKPLALTILSQRMTRPPQGLPAVKNNKAHLF